MPDAFAEYLVHEKRVSRHTLNAYRTDLGQFREFLQVQFGEEDPAGATPAMVRSWVVRLTDDGISPVTVNRKIAALRAFYRFLKKKRIINADPGAQLKMLRTRKAPPSFVEERAMETLFDRVEFPTGFAGLRDRMILEILYGTGLRLSELAGLTVGSLSLEARTFRVVGKRQKERIVPFPAGMVPLLQEYLEGRAAEGPGAFLLVTGSGKQMYPVFVQRTVKKYLSAVTSLEKKSPHVLRHTYATHLLNRGADLNAIKELLGHASLAATQVYTHNSIEKLKKSYKQAHPKA